MGDLERTIDEKIKPLLDQAMHQYLGIKVVELEQDISSKLKHLDEVDISIPFKKAKRLFKKAYLTRLLQHCSGNVAKASLIAGIDRRSIHRLITSLKIPIIDYRELKTYARQDTVTNILESSVETYKSSLNPERIKQFYKIAPSLSKNILEQLPEQPKSFSDAEKEFERQYIEKAIKLFNNNLSKTAKAIGLRYEVLHRKKKSLGVNHPHSRPQ